VQATEQDTPNVKSIKTTREGMLAAEPYGLSKLLQLSEIGPAQELEQAAVGMVYT
jgi:hypothetical protein